MSDAPVVLGLMHNISGASCGSICWISSLLHSFVLGQNRSATLRSFEESSGDPTGLITASVEQQASRQTFVSSPLPMGSVHSDHISTT